MKRMKRWVSLVLALVMLLTILCGCQEEAEEVTTLMQLDVAMVGEPATLDPAYITTDTERTVVLHLFENLMKLTPTGVVNAQAKSYTCINNDDGTQTYVFTLRDDITWSDGLPVTANHFVYAWKRLAAPETASPHAHLLDDVVGYDKAAAGDPDALQVSVDEEGNFVVVLSQPCPDFLSTICVSPETMPLRSDYVTTASDWSLVKKTCLTNGAYALRQWFDGKLVAIEKEKYYDSRQLGPDQLQFHFVATEQDAQQSYLDGTVDAAFGVNYAEGSEEVTLPQVGVLVVNQMGSTMRREVLRQAMNMVIDRNALAETLGAGYTAASGLVPAGISTLAGISFREAAGDIVDINPGDYRASVDTALTMLTDAGLLRDGVPTYSLGTLTLLFEANANAGQIAQVLKKTWGEELGISVTLEPVPTAELEERLMDGEFAMALMKLSTDRNTATGYLNNWRSGVEGNYGQYHSTAYDMLLSVAAKSGSVEAHDAYLEDAERMLVEGGYVMPIYMTTTSYYAQENLTGIVYNGLGAWYLGGMLRVPAVN